MSQQPNTYAARLHQAFSKKFNFKTILALVVFGLIILSFILSGFMGSKGSHLGMGVAATVNGEIISLKQFQDQENRVSAYYSQMLGGQFESLIQKKHLQTEALNQLVDNSVAAQEAEVQMIYATDTNVRVAIQEMPYFKKDGVFQSDLYKGVLASNGLTPGDFEKSMRQQISIQKVRDLFEASTIVTGLEKSVDDDLKQSKINLYYVKISSELFNSAQQISDATVNAELAKPEFKARVEEALKSNPKETNLAAGRKILADAKALELAKQVESVVSKNADQKTVEEFLTQQNLKLKETGLFEISTETVPVINSLAAFKAALDLTKEKPVAKNLVKEGDAQYLIILKDIVKTAPSSDVGANSKRNEMLEKQKSYSQYQYWLENSKKLFSINKNMEIIQQ